MQRTLKLKPLPLTLTVIIGLMVTLIISFSAPVLTNAQEANALLDPGFEGEYTSRGRADLNIPATWSLWYTESPRTEDWMNLVPIAFPHNGPGPDPHGGSRALNFNRGYATFTVAIYQQVSVTSGSNVTASAWAQIKTCDVPANADNCQSSGSGGAVVRIGIDPNGGTNPFDNDIVWSANIAPHDIWQQMSTSATTTAGTATVFIFGSQNFPTQLNRLYLDDAFFGGGGAGGAAQGDTPASTPVPPPPAEVPFVAPQNARPDGSIVHIVGVGDTIDSIAVAYGLTRPDIMALNPVIRDPRIIQIGQEIIVRAANSGSAAESTDEADGAGVGSPAATEDAPVDEPIEAESTEEAAPESESTDEPPQEVELREPVSVADAAPAPVRSAAEGVQPAIDPSASMAAVCVSLFNDLNRNRIQEFGEDLLSGGTVIINTLGGAESAIQPYETDGASEPFCFDGLAPNDYIASVQAPSGYGLTTPDQLVVRAEAGIPINIAFGAAEGVQAIQPPPADAGGLVNEEVADQTDTASSNPIGDNLGLIVFGAAAVVLIGGLGVTLFLRRR